MIEHLSAEQISQWIVGERTPQLERHVAGCAQCGAELEQMEAALSQFRTAMRAPVHSVPPFDWREPATPASWFSWSRMALAAAVLLILIGLPVSWMAHVREQQASAAAAALADSQLLERVDSAISQPVPEPMEPLVTLVTWSSSPTDLKQVNRQSR
jgi:hypothetical protein